MNSGRPQDDTNGLVRSFASAHDPSEVSSLQEHRQRELGKLKTTGVLKVLGQEALESRECLASVIETALENDEPGPAYGLEDRGSQRGKQWA